MGSAACRACHPSQFQQQASSAHARALAPSTDAAIQADWAFGAGAQAVTFVSRLDDTYYLEHNLTYYPRVKAYAATPGHEKQAPPGLRYRIFDPSAAILRCFQCHSTGPLTIADGNRIQPFDLGVRCESCHGPGSDHTKSPSKANIVNPKRYTATEINRHCGSCHRMPAAPGEGIDWNSDWNVRHQPLYLAESACFQKSAGKLSCLTCHDPHTGAATPACASCHASVRHKPATRTPGASCLDCHMPAVRPNPQLAFHNHWIGVYASGNALLPLRRAGPSSSPRKQ